MCLDLAIINVRGYTLHEEKPLVTAVGIKGQHLDQIGNNQEIQESISGKTQIIDGQGMTLLPGFRDAHIHFATMAIGLDHYLDLGTVKNREELLAEVKKTVQKKKKGDWVTGTGWDESKWEGDQRFMTREELDQIAPENPVALNRVDTHIYCVNSMALKILHFPPHTRGVEKKDGRPTGRLVEEAGYQIHQYIEAEGRDILPGLKKAIQIAHSLGVTAIHDILIDREKLKAYQYLRDAQQLQLRVGFFLGDDYLDQLLHLGLFSLGDEYLRLLGIKLFVDGSIGARTAMVKQGYQGAPKNYGYPIWDDEALQEIIKKAHTDNIPLAIHTIGDLAVEKALEALAFTAENKNRLHHRLEHIELITHQQMKQMKKLGITASMQPNFTEEWGHPGSMYEKRLGPEIIKNMNPLRHIVDENIPLFLGSDGMPFQPLYGIHAAVNPPFPGQRLTPLEAVRSYTQGGNRAIPGRISPGELADLVLLEGDPWREPENIKDMKVRMTVFDGPVVFADKERIVSETKEADQTL